MYETSTGEKDAQASCHQIFLHEVGEPCAYIYAEVFYTSQ